MAIHFTIPGRPRGKDRPRSMARLVGQGSDARAIATVYNDQETELAEAEISRLFRLAAGGRRVHNGPIHLRIVAIFPIPTGWSRALQRAALEGGVYCTSKPDDDNITKLIQDALNWQAYADDSQVAVLELIKRYGDPARTEVSIRQLDVPDGLETPQQKKLARELKAHGVDGLRALKQRKRNLHKTNTGGLI